MEVESATVTILLVLLMVRVVDPPSAREVDDHLAANAGVSWVWTEPGAKTSPVAISANTATAMGKKTTAGRESSSMATGVQPS